MQIGANDGRTNDRLWSFRRYPAWSGTLVEPGEAAFRRLAANYGAWPDRFTLVKAAVASRKGLRPFYQLADGGELPGHLDQVGSLDEALVRRHRRHLSPREAIPIGVTEVVCLTFAELAEASGPAAPNLVLVDAEGSDASIIAQLDFATCRPEVVVYEHVHLEQADRTTTARRLDFAGYATLPLGQDTLAVAREALQRLPCLGEAWRLVAAARREV